MRKICIVTSTRADWGILMPLARKLRRSGRVDLQILATNMHLLDAYGHTADAIIADGFSIDAKVPMPDANGADAASRARAMGTCAAGVADAFARLKPDAVLLLGDRFEMLAVASAAAVMAIPIIHMHGGEISEGAIDDSIRHAITKLSTIHLTATEQYRRRVIQMGEHPGRVINTGSIGVWNIFNSPRIPSEQILTALDLPANEPYAVATFHPATLDPADPGEQCRTMLQAVMDRPGLNLIVTYPNNDTGSEAVIAAIEDYTSRYPGRIAAVPSLGLQRYLSACAGAEFVIGNSSSGIIEVPSLGVPVINLGIRQRGRMRSEAVVDSPVEAGAIAKAIDLAEDPAHRRFCYATPNPYEKPDSPQLACEAVLDFVSTLPAPPKTFYDLPPCK